MMCRLTAYSYQERIKDGKRLSMPVCGLQMIGIITKNNKPMKNIKNEAIALNVIVDGLQKVKGFFAEMEAIKAQTSDFENIPETDIEMQIFSDCILPYSRCSGRILLPRLNLRQLLPDIPGVSQ